jgi:Ras-related protein Rab-1A
MITGSDKLTATPYKLIIIGDSCTGKSSLLLKLVDGTFTESHKVTIGVDFKAKYVLVGDTVVKLKIWDTAGQERFRSIIRTYYHGVHGIVLVFDLTNKESFDNLRNWMKEIYEIGVGNCSIILIGNKCDLTEKREITQKDIDTFIEDYDLKIKYYLI